MANNWLYLALKRLFDFTVALGLIILFSPIFILLALAILILDGRPIFYASERAKTADKCFQIYKFRTMKPAGNAKLWATGGDKSDRITRSGRFLRKTRLDELPQLVNILLGQMSFVGPRPPLKTYVDRNYDLYKKVLRSKPGITGLATLKFHGIEARMLAHTKTPEETDRIYNHYCVPRKAKLDLLYQKRASLSLDMWILFQTVMAVLRSVRR